MEKAYQEIKKKDYSISLKKKYKRREGEDNKEKWYKIGKAIEIHKRKVKLHPESKIAARKAYLYYKSTKRNWKRPTP